PPVGIEQHLDGAESLVDGIEEEAIARFALVQGAHGLAAFGDVIGRTDPLHDFARFVENGHGPRANPADTAVAPENPVFLLVSGLAVARPANGFADTGPVIRIDVAIGPAGACHGRSLALPPASQGPQFLPIRTHP